MFSVRVSAVLLLVGILVGAAGGWAYYKPRLDEATSTITSLEGRISELEKRVGSLEAQVEERDQRIAELESLLDSARENASRLARSLEEVEAEKQRLVETLEEANETIENLTRHVRLLEENLTVLEERLSKAIDMLEEVNGSLKEAAQWYGLLGRWINDEILEAAVESLPGWAVAQAVDGPTVEDRIYNIMEWILWNLEYDYDSPVRVVDPEDYTVIVWDDYVMLPNETLYRGGGDCDDLALLAYSILVRSDIPWMKVYLVAWYPSEGPGHVAVLARLGDEYYIFDPAGNWLNGVSFYLLVRVVDENDPNYYWEAYLIPQNLAPEEKEYLAENGLASMVYYVWREDTLYYDRPPLIDYTDPYRILSAWIRGYWNVDPVYIEIIGDGVYEGFYSIEQAASWLGNPW